MLYNTQNMEYKKKKYIELFPRHKITQNKMWRNRKKGCHARAESKEKEENRTKEKQNIIFISQFSILPCAPHSKAPDSGIEEKNHAKDRKG